MPKYSSRVNSGGGAQQKKPGAKPKAKPSARAKSSGGTLGGAIEAAKVKPSEKVQLEIEVNALDSATPDIAATTGGNLIVGGGTAVGGGQVVGGGFLDEIKGGIESIASTVGKVKDVVAPGLRAVSRSGSPAELSRSLRGVVGKLSHNGMIQVLQHMNPQQFHVLQGVAGAHLPNFNSHPLSGVARKVLGGSFTHPRNISKMATRDIVRCVSPQQCASALHMEFLDKQRGMPVGGGLLDSLKHNFNRGLEGLKSGVEAGTRVGDVLHSALSTGIKVGQVFSPVVESLFPGAGKLIDSGITSAEALKAGLEVGVKAGEALQVGLEGISPLDTSSSPSKAQPFTDPLVGADVQLPARPEFDAPAPPAFQDVSQEFPGLSEQELRNMGLI